MSYLNPIKDVIIFFLLFNHRLDVNNGSYKELDRCKDVPTLTSAFRLFFRELNRPLINRDVIDSALALNLALSNIGYDMQEKTIAQIKSCIDAPPALNYKVLNYILLHLKRVADNEENKMGASNLSKIFGQSLIENVSIGNLNMDELMIQTERSNKLIEIFIMYVVFDILDICSKLVFLK